MVIYSIITLFAYSHMLQKIAVLFCVVTLGYNTKRCAFRKHTSSLRESKENPMTRTSYPVSQQNKIPALWKHAAVLFQHHGQLLPSGNVLWKLITVSNAVSTSYRNNRPCISRMSSNNHCDILNST